MLYHFLLSLQDTFSFLRVVQYISFRIFVSILTALALGMLLGRPIIRYLKNKQGGSSNVREDTPESHQVKSGTPTMGGIIIILTTLLSFLLWADLDGLLPWVCIITLMGFALIGYVDDISKIKKRGGMSARVKFGLQCLLSAGLGYLLMTSGFDTSLTIPFVKNANIVLGATFIPFVMLVLVGSSNAVNLTDGLDGLAVGPTLIASITYLFFAYMAGNAFFADYLQITYVPGAGEVCILCAALFGSCLSFLWFNTYPAQVFMGDVGSLTIGGVLGMVAVLAKQELLLILVGGVFVLEASSVIIQVVSYKLTGKRVFRMAPIHHHFELKGWAEPKVIVRFWIISIVLALISLSTLKLR